MWNYKWWGDGSGSSLTEFAFDSFNERCLCWWMLGSLLFFLWSENGSIQSQAGKGRCLWSNTRNIFMSGRTVLVLFCLCLCCVRNYFKGPILKQRCPCTQGVSIFSDQKPPWKDWNNTVFVTSFQRKNLNYWLEFKRSLLSQPLRQPFTFCWEHAQVRVKS